MAAGEESKAAGHWRDAAGMLIVLRAEGLQGRHNPEGGIQLREAFPGVPIARGRYRAAAARRIHRPRPVWSGRPT
jgi:hypothetical protein